VVIEPLVDMLRVVACAALIVVCAAAPISAQDAHDPGSDARLRRAMLFGSRLPATAPGVPHAPLQVYDEQEESRLRRTGGWALWGAGIGLAGSGLWLAVADDVVFDLVAVLAASTVYGAAIGGLLGFVTH